MSYAEAVKSPTMIVAASSGGCEVSTVLAWLSGSIIVASIAEPDSSHDAGAASVQGVDEHMNEQMKDCVSSVEMLPNT